MKKRIVLLFLTLFVFVSVFAETYSHGDVLYVSVKSVKSGKQVFAYGDKVVVDETSGKKVMIHLADNAKVSGWVSVSNLTKKKIVKTKNGSYVNASSDEIALAGKGISETAEQLFKNDNPDISFDSVDKMEKLEISDDELSKFVEEGHLCK